MKQIGRLAALIRSPHHRVSEATDFQEPLVTEHTIRDNVYNKVTSLTYTEGIEPSYRLDVGEKRWLVGRAEKNEEQHDLAEST